MVRKRKPKKAEDGRERARDWARVEFQAPPGWVEALDRHAAALGLTRDSYIRMACNRQMTDDDLD